MDTSPPPGTGGRQYYIYLQAFNATNESNVAQRIFIVYQGTNGVSVMPKESIFTLAIYPNPTTSTLHIESTSNVITITDLLGRIWLHSKDGSHDLDVSGLPQGVYSISDGKSRAQFVKE
jgi:hypothetical protein